MKLNKTILDKAIAENNAAKVPINEFKEMIRKTLTPTQ